MEFVYTKLKNGEAKIDKKTTKLINENLFETICSYKLDKPFKEKIKTVYRNIQNYANNSTNK